MKKYFKILFTFVLMFCFSSLVKADSLGCYFSLFNVYNGDTYDVWYLNNEYNVRNGPTSLDDNVGSATVERSGSNCISIFNMQNSYFNNNFYGYVIGFYNNGVGNRIYYNAGDDQVFNLYITQIYYNVLKSGNFKIDVWDSSTTMNKREQKVYKYSDYCKTKTNKIGAYDFAVECNFPYSFSQNSYLTFYPTYLPFSSLSNTGLAYRIDNNYENINDSINNATDKILQGQDKINDTLNSEDSDTSSKKCGVVCKLKGIWEGITNLPTLIVDKIKGLFVPDNFDFLTNFKDTLENKLGFIASIPIQVLDYLISLKDKVFTPITTIKFPKISIFGYYFWDEYTINTSDGLSWISSFKYFTDLGCVIICINTLRKWYSNFTGGDEK